jgi:pimeloyl-ACP methyl ester carboxylesterase
VPWETRELPVGDEESIHVVVLGGKGEAKKGERVFFMGHGFGGSSLMNFGIIGPLLAKGQVVLWEIRGMGVSQKLKNYPIDSL